MKIRQTVRHFSARAALETPVVGPRVHDRLVGMHTDIFLEKADPDHREQRRDHLDGLFDATVEMYRVALQAGHTEATARELTHIVANFDFYNHGWTEMLEFPAEERTEHYERYADFFGAHDITLENPLGEFEPDGGIPAAPATPDRLENPEEANATGGYADDVYVEDEDGTVTRGGTTE